MSMSGIWARKTGEHREHVVRGDAPPLEDSARAKRTTRAPLPAVGLGVDRKLSLLCWLTGMAAGAIGGLAFELASSGRPAALVLLDGVVCLSCALVAAWTYRRRKATLRASKPKPPPAPASPLPDPWTADTGRAASFTDSTPTLRP